MEDREEIPIQLVSGRASALIYSFVFLYKLKPFLSSQPNSVISPALPKRLTQSSASRTPLPVLSSSGILCLLRGASVQPGSQLNLFYKKM